MKTNCTNLEINNVIKIERFIDKVYPFAYDYGALAEHYKVITFENGTFIEKKYVTDKRFGEDLHCYELNIHYIDNVDEMLEKYNQFCKDSVIESSKKDGNSLKAKAGDTIEVYKGRKYPKGTRFVVKRESVWKDVYGREQAWYWVTECGKKVDQFNCIIVDVA